MKKDPMLLRRQGFDLTVGLSVFEPPTGMLEPLRVSMGRMLDDADPEWWTELPVLIPEEEDDAGARAWARVLYWREIVARQPDRPGAQLTLAEALVEAGKLPQAGEALRKAHEQNPADLEVAELIVMLMEFQGLDWRRFAWIEPPTVVVRNPAACDPAWDWLVAHGGVDSDRLFSKLFEEKITLFDPAGFSALLEEDGRFSVERGHVEVRVS